jgi:hypothetical protein
MMKARLIFFSLLSVFFLSQFGFASGEFYYLGAEPLVRIGLTTNASSVSITTAGTELVAYSLDEPNRPLGTSRVTVSARAYRPPEIENYRFEIKIFRMPPKPMSSRKMFAKTPARQRS